MNRVYALLVMPWVASAKYARWLTVLFVGVASIVAAALAVTGESHAHRSGFILALAFAVWALWGSCLGANIQLARNARDLCLPRVQRDADLSLLLFAAISLAVPAGLCWILGATPLLAAAVFVVAAASGFAYMLLPFWMGLALLMATLMGIMAYGLDVRMSTLWALGASLTAFDVFRWWQLRSAAAVTRDGMNAAAVFWCYRQDAMRNGGWFGFSQRLLQERVTAPTHASLKDVGPQHIVGSIRFALGGIGMPKPFASHLRDFGRLLVYVGAFLLFFLLAPLVTSPVAAGERIVHWLSPLLAYASLLLCCSAVTMFAGRTRSMWRKTDAELPLLALLPGLGDAASARRSALTALFVPAAFFLGCACAVLCLATLALHAKPWAYLAMALCCAGALMLIVAVTLASLSGRVMHPVEYALWYIVQLVLSMLVLMKAMPTDQYHGAHPELIGVVPAWLLAAWGVYLLVLAILAIHGARGLRERPHAFLPNTA